MQCAVNERNTDPGGKYEHQVIWPPADSLSISAVAEGRVVLCVLRGHGHKHRHHTWDNKSQNYGTHVKAIHAWHPVFSFFFFSLLLLSPLHPNNHPSWLALCWALGAGTAWPEWLQDQDLCEGRTCWLAVLALSHFQTIASYKFFPSHKKEEHKKTGWICDVT